MCLRPPHHLFSPLKGFRSSGLDPFLFLEGRATVPHLGGLAKVVEILAKLSIQRQDYAWPTLASCRYLGACL